MFAMRLYQRPRAVRTALVLPVVAALVASAGCSTMVGGTAVVAGPQIGARVQWGPCRVAGGGGGNAVATAGNTAEVHGGAGGLGGNGVTGNGGNGGSGGAATAVSTATGGNGANGGNSTGGGKGGFAGAGGTATGTPAVPGAPGANGTPPPV